MTNPLLVTLSVTARVTICLLRLVPSKVIHRPLNVMLHVRHCTAAANRRLNLPRGACARWPLLQQISFKQYRLYKMEVDRPQAANGEASTSGKQARNFSRMQLGKALGPRDRMLK
jgi:hypothetical protein